MVELLFMMLILKLPILYLGAVCWWAIRAEPKPVEGARLPVQPEPPPWRPRPGRRPRRSGPRGGPRRTYARAARAQLVR